MINLLLFQMARNLKTLADRVIAESDLKAERLIALLRMTLAAMLFLGVAFVISQSKSVGLEARQFELFSLLAGALGYFALGAINYYCATAARLRPWMSWGFNLAEVMLVSIQLYIDVANPLTPSLLAFASPVLLVAALVICVQVLRYQIWLHVFSTLLLVGLCGLILLHDPQIGGPLSPEASHELQLLYSLPPNIVRLVMLAAMAFLIGIAVSRSRNLIEAVAKETELAENRKRFLPSEISNRMTDNDLDTLRMGEERELAILFVDIRGFTAISNALGPRETADFLRDFRAIVTQSVILNDGVVDKFIGDGALTVFGLHSDIKQACIDAANTAQQLMTSLSNWNQKRAEQEKEAISIVIGFHAGPAIVGAIGDDQRLEFTVIGNTVNLAARLEEVAKEKGWTLAVSRHAAGLAGLNEEEFLPVQSIVLRGNVETIEVLAQSQIN